MQAEQYNVTTYSVGVILNWIQDRSIAIPEIQRPFVWKKTQVRDLIDSLYKGYPTGYLIIWQNPSVKLKDGRDSQGKKILIDGQQRVTALMAAILGEPVFNDDYQRLPIRIAFNPIEAIRFEFLQDNEVTGIFEVQNPSHLKDKRWIPDISEVFKSGFSTHRFVTTYCGINSEVDPDQLDAVITNLRSIANRQIGVIDLSHRLDIEVVTEIFIRINSQGKTLSQADFAMSKIAADETYGGNMLRKAIDYFCHLSVEPSFFEQISENDNEFMSSEFATKLSWLRDENDMIYIPDYNDMLRVSFIHKFGRGKLADLVSLLSGRDFATREYKEVIAEESFDRLRHGIMNFMNEHNFKQFVLAIRSAGFISERLIRSQMALDFAYVLFLKLMESNEVQKTEIKRYVQKWYVLSVLTGRYSGSPETIMDRDIRTINERGFLQFFKETEEAELSKVFWNIGLVQALETSVSNSPYFCVYLASQVHGVDSCLFSSSLKVAELIMVAGNVHHIFPRKYLKENGITKPSKYNQVANYVYLDTQINISIGKKSPQEYFGRVFESVTSNESIYGNISDIYELKQNLAANCIPEGIAHMDASQYDDFLLKRRRLMAEKIQRYYDSL